MKRFFCMLSSVILHFVATAQPSQLSGRVFDRYNSPVPFATIVSKKQGIVSAIADRNGFYTITNLMAGDTLVCTQTNYVLKEEKVEGNNVINFYLERKPLFAYQVDLSGKGNHHTPPQTSNSLPPNVYSGGDMKARVEINASYPGGAEKLYQFLQGSLGTSKELRQTTISGAVKLNVMIDENGRVTDPLLIKGINNYYNQAVVDAITKTKWYAAEQNGRKVKSYQEIVVIF